MSIIFNQICINEELLPIYIYIYIYKHDLALNNPKGLVYHKTFPKQTTPLSGQL